MNNNNNVADMQRRLRGFKLAAVVFSGLALMFLAVGAATPGWAVSHTASQPRLGGWVSGALLVLVAMGAVMIYLMRGCTLKCPSYLKQT
jgi:hypothetical protein